MAVVMNNLGESISSWVDYLKPRRCIGRRLPIWKRLLEPNTPIWAWR